MPEKSEVLTPGTFEKLGLRTLSELYDYAVENFRDLTAMKKHHPWGYQSISYQEFGKLVSFLGSGLIGMGLEKGDRVVLMADNSPEWPLVYAAVTSCGAAIVPLDIRLKRNELRHLLLHSEAKMLIVSPGVYNELLDGMQTGAIETIVIGERDALLEGATLAEVMASGKEKINSGSSAFFRRKTEVNPDDIAAICYTSGTTGQPKGAVLLHSNLIANTESIRCRLPITDSDVFLALLPMHHTFATMCLFLAPLSAGSTIAFGRSMKSRIIMEDVARENVTVLVGVPLLFEHLAVPLGAGISGGAQGGGFVKRIFGGISRGIGRLLRGKPGRASRKRLPAGFENIRLCVSGAASLRPNIENALLSAGLPLLQGYGLTEASPVISVNPLGKQKAGTVGPPLPGIEVKIESPDAEGIGEIVVKGANVMKEYYRNPEGTAEVLRRGRLYTGDLGKLDGDGFITIAGRKKSVIVTAGGKNIYPYEIETLLCKSRYILEALVIPVQDSKGNSRPGAVIVPDYDALGSIGEPSGNLTEEKIKEIISGEISSICSGLADYKRISVFQIRDEEFPKTTTRKIKRHMVRWIEE